MKRVLTILTMATALTAAMLLTTACGMEQVDTGYRGIKTTFGEVQGEPLGEGLHFYNPFTSDIMEYPVRDTVITGKTFAFTSDTQNAEITFSATWRPEPKSVGDLWKKFGYIDDVEGKIVQASILGAMKDAIGQVTAGDLNQKRELVTAQALKEINDKLAADHIQIGSLNFTNVDFDDAYEQAVEAKVVATQLAAKAKNDTVTIEEQSKQTIITAKAQAESMRIQSEALSKNQNLVNYEMVKKWDGKLPQYQFGNSSTLIDLKSLQGK